MNLKALGTDILMFCSEAGAAGSRQEGYGPGISGEGEWKDESSGRSAIGSTGDFTLLYLFVEGRGRRKEEGVAVMNLRRRQGDP